MTTGEETFRTLQAAARSTAAKTQTTTPTQEYLTRHLLESFLDRLTRTNHGEDFVLKGGILLAAYGARRPTKDADAIAISANVTTDHLITVVHDIAAVDTTDGVAFDVNTITAQEIREHADYPGYRAGPLDHLEPVSATPGVVGLACHHLTLGLPFGGQQLLTLAV